MSYGLSYIQKMEQIRTENIRIIQDIYTSTCELANWLRKKYWKDKRILAIIKELEQDNEEFYREMLSDRQDINKIYWKKRQNNGQTKNRDIKPAGNLHWRKQGFRKQGLET